MEEERRTEQARHDPRQQAARAAQERQWQPNEARRQREVARELERLTHGEPAAAPPWPESGCSGSGRDTPAAPEA